MSAQPTSLDQSLDQLAAASRRKGRGGRRSGGPRTVDGATATNGAAKPAGNARTRYAGAVPAANGNRAAPAAPVAAPLQADATRILISNLPHDVTEPQIKDLFASTVGGTRDVTITYDSRGISKGIAAVTFSKRGDANKAFTQYNGRVVDGKKAMKIEIVVDPARPQTLSQRVAPAPAAPAAAAPAGPAAGKAAPSRGQGGRRGRGGRKKGPERPQKTVADLDAEMEDYTKTSEPVAAT